MALVYIFTHIIVHVFVLFCLNPASMAAYKATGPHNITPLALLIVWAIKLHMPWVMLKALLAKCWSPIGLVHEGYMLGQCHLFLA